jgi:hypothetical protein
MFGTKFCPSGYNFASQSATQCTKTAKASCPSGYSPFGEIDSGADICSDTGGALHAVSCPSNWVLAIVKGGTDTCTSTKAPVEASCASGSLHLVSDLKGGDELSHQVGDPAYTCLQGSKPKTTD